MRAIRFVPTIVSVSVCLTATSVFGQAVTLGTLISVAASGKALNRVPQE